MIEAGSTISLENISPFPVNIRKYSHVADIKPTSTVEADDKVRAVHLNTLDNFKYTPLAKRDQRILLYADQTPTWMEEERQPGSKPSLAGTRGNPRWSLH